MIALDIDDAGPTLSALANDLLLASYGPRFTLQVITQSTNGKGELREDFDIIVHDGVNWSVIDIVRRRDIAAWSLSVEKAL